jgi:hypothetical protein
MPQEFPGTADNWEAQGGIAHDFNNLLTVIIGNRETAELHNGLDASAAARRLKAIANALRGAGGAASGSSVMRGCEASNPSRSISTR